MTLGLKKLGEVIADYIISTVGGPVPVVAVPVAQVLRPVSIQTQSLALRALRKRKPQETQALALASSQSWLPLLRSSIPIGWRLRLLLEICVSCAFRLRNARNASDCV